MSRKARLEPGKLAGAMKEGREARKDGRARKSPYEGISMLLAFHQPWLDGWDDMDAVLRKGADDAKQQRT